MTEFEILRNLKATYSNTSLNEADTRFKIIDSVIRDVLKWPDTAIFNEVYLNGNKADYVLKGKNNKPILVVESKNTDVYFDLPQSSNTKNLFQKITVEKLLTDPNIKAAINQVKEYAEDLVCPFAAICNGNCWIIFKVFGTQKPWKKLAAFVIKDIDFFLENYTDAINIWGYNSV